MTFSQWLWLVIKLNLDIGRVTPAQRQMVTFNGKLNRITQGSDTLYHNSFAAHQSHFQQAASEHFPAVHSNDGSLLTRI
jgi:hypothetical protein